MADKKNKKQRRADYQAPKKANKGSPRPQVGASAANTKGRSKKSASLSNRPSGRQARGGTLSWWLLGGGIVGVVALVIALSIALGDSQSGETAATGWDLPALDVDTDPDGDGRVTLSEFEGKPLVLNFFASWCTSCDRELPIFRQAVDDFADDVQIVFVNSNETGNWRPMAERNGIDDQVLIDDIGGSNNNGLYRSLGGTGGMPITAFYDADGNVFDVVIGEFDSTALYEALMRVLAA